MLTLQEQGLYCEAGDFFIDPWRPVDTAFITHAHSDHARGGSRQYFCAREGVDVLRLRLGKQAFIRGIDYGERLVRNGVTVSFHPAGHVLGSAQVRMERGGETWVVSGDYKTEQDPTCTPFEPVTCHTFVTESTFGLPIYQWAETKGIFDEIHDWWRANREAGRVSVLFGYSLGKAQRLLNGLDTAQGPILVHDAVRAFLPVYAQSGVSFPEVTSLSDADFKDRHRGALVVTPPASQDASWLRALGNPATAMVSGWMLLRGTRRRRGVERGFALSDHADWPGLVKAIRATEAERVLVTHGNAAPLTRWLNEGGWKAEVLPTRFEGDPEE